MMYCSKKLLFLMGIATLYIIPHELNDHEFTQKQIGISRSTHLTFRRYYFVSRLSKTINLLLKVQDSTHFAFSRNAHHMNFDLTFFSDKRIIQSLQRIQQTRSLKPLFMIWDDFIAYRSLEDDVFIEDFSKEIFVITHSVLSSFETNEIENPQPLDTIIRESKDHKEGLLDIIDDTTCKLQQMFPKNCFVSRRNISPPLDLKSGVTTDEIALRFYFIQRLEQAVNIVCSAKNASVFRSLDYASTFRSSHIKSLFRIMQETGAPDAMANTWDEMKEYKFIDNIEFVKEFASLVFIALRHLYPGLDQPIIGSSIEKMEIEDLLHAVDIITDQLSASAQMQNSYSAHNSKDWLRHYWWIPPLTIGSIAIKLAHYYYTLN